MPGSLVSVAGWPPLTAWLPILEMVRYKAKNFVVRDLLVLSSEALCSLKRVIEILPAVEFSKQFGRPPELEDAPENVPLDLPAIERFRTRFSSRRPRSVVQPVPERCR